MRAGVGSKRINFAYLFGLYVDVLKPLRHIAFSFYADDTALVATFRNVEGLYHEKNPGTRPLEIFGEPSE